MHGPDILSKSDSTKQLGIHTFRQYSISSLIKDKLCFILDPVLKLCSCLVLFRCPRLPAKLQLF
jgi:hypothetical protein